MPRHVPPGYRHIAPQIAVDDVAAIRDAYERLAPVYRDVIGREPSLSGYTEGCWTSAEPHRDKWLGEVPPPGNARGRRNPATSTYGAPRRWIGVIWSDAAVNAAEAIKAETGLTRAALVGTAVRWQSDRMLALLQATIAGDTNAWYELTAALRAMRPMGVVDQPDAAT